MEWISVKDGLPEIPGNGYAHITVIATDTTIPVSVQPARGKETEEEAHTTKTSGVCFPINQDYPKSLISLRESK